MKLWKWSMGYWFIKQYVRFANWLIHKQITVIGKENLPKNKPVIFAPNHQNALMDPLSVVCYVPDQPVWLARADIFSNKFVRPILRFMKLIPVYRIRDGKENLGLNDQTFNESISVLQNNNSLALFPEAAHSWKRQMLPHKKAIPRIVFLAEGMTDFKLDLQIVPVGISYSHYWHFNRRLFVNFGKPVAAKDYREQYFENPHTATMALREDIRLALLPLILEYSTKENYEGFEVIRELFSDAILKLRKIVNSPETKLQSDQLLIEKLDELEKSDPQKANLLANQSTTYQLKLRKLNLRNWLVDIGRENWFQLIINTLLLVITSPLFVFGFLFNAIPFFIVDKYVRKTFKNIVFRSSFFLGSGLLVFPVFYFFELVVLRLFIPNSLVLVPLFILFPIAGKIAFSWFISMKKTVGRARWMLIKLTKPAMYQQIHAEKASIYEEIKLLVQG